MPSPSPSTRGPLTSGIAAVASALAAVSCCLPLGPFVFAAGFAGTSGILLGLQPYLIACSVFLLLVGFVQAVHARRCGRRRGILNIAVLTTSTALVAVMLFAYVPAAAPAGQPSVATFDMDTFRRAFNAAADHTRILVLLSPT
jgi:hypothetical protein